MLQKVGGDSLFRWCKENVQVERELSELSEPVYKIKICRLKYNYIVTCFVLLRNLVCHSKARQKFKTFVKKAWKRMFGPNLRKKKMADKITRSLIICGGGSLVEAEEMLKLFPHES
jgi:hypothetical protein